MEWHRVVIEWNALFSQIAVQIILGVVLLGTTALVWLWKKGADYLYRSLDRIDKMRSRAAPNDVDHHG